MNTTTNTTIGYASYQQQYASSESQPNDLASIILFFSIIFVMLVSFIFYFWFTEWHKVPPQQRREEELEHQKEIDQLVQNLKEQIKCTFKIPLGGLVVLLWKGLLCNQTEPTTTSVTSPVAIATHSPDLPVSREHRKVLAHKFYHLFSVLFLVAVFVALFTLIGADVSPVSDNTSNILQAALFVFVLCINLFLITRQRFYYKDRKDLFGHDDAHLKAVYKTRFTDWDSKMWSNWIQIIILIIEFFQLLTFPLRDLMTVTSFDSYRTENQTQFTHLLTLIMNAGGLMPDMRTPTWYTYSVWTAFATTMVSLVVAVIVHTVNVRRPYKIPNRWVRWCIPVASLLYIPILTTFVSSAACQSLNISTNDYASTLRCYAPQISHKLYLWLSLVGYVIAYCLLTLFLTSYERIPRYNEIAFKSISVAIIKNMGLLLANVFLLVESTSTKNRMRAILSIIILLTMICYNIKTRPCYVDKINFFRSASFSCILWTSSLIAILSDTNAAQSLGPWAVLFIIIGGWALIIILFVLIYFIYYKQPEDYIDDDVLDPEATLKDKAVFGNFSYGHNTTTPPGGSKQVGVGGVSPNNLDPIHELDEGIVTHYGNEKHQMEPQSTLPNEPNGIKKSSWVSWAFKWGSR